MLDDRCDGKLHLVISPVSKKPCEIARFLNSKNTTFFRRS